MKYDFATFWEIGGPVKLALTIDQGARGAFVANADLAAALPASSQR